MATLRQFYYRVLEDGQFKTSLPAGISSFFDVNLLNGDSASKISIQAPPGTEIQLDNKSIIVGRSGLYDFDNTDVPAVTSLVFPQPKRYIRSEVIQADKLLLENFLRTIQGQIDTSLSDNPLSTDNDYKNFSLDGQKIYQGERTKTAAQSVYNFNFNGTTLYGFSGVLSQYLKTIQGELTTENIDIMNVVVNYIAD